MKKQPLVTVSVVTYNHKNYIAQCLESILNQTYKNLEIIVVDDCSTDNTVDIIKSFQDPRIQLITKPKNRGVSDSTGIYLQKAQGSYIATMCGDDSFAMPDKIQKQVQFLQDNPDYQAVFSNINFINEESAPLPIEDNRFAKDLSNAFKKGIELNDRHKFLNYFFKKCNVLCGPTLLADMKVFKELGPFDVRYQQLQDYHMWIKMVVNGYNFYVLSDKTINYRIREKGQNLSAPSEEVFNRLYYEQARILEEYWTLPLEDFKKAFPEYQIPGTPDQDLVPYYLQDMVNGTKHTIHELFSINTLHKLYENVSRELLEKIEENTGYTPRDYYKKLGEFPLTSLYIKKPSLKQKLISIITGRTSSK